MPDLTPADIKIQETLNRLAAAQRCLDSAYRQLGPVVGAENRCAEIRQARDQVREEWHRLHRWWTKNGSKLEVSRA